MDTVLPASERSEGYQFRMWAQWINENLASNHMSDSIGKHDSLPQAYKDGYENKPDSLFDQLEMLRKSGFEDVDCYFKYANFALFGGTKKK